MTSGILVEPHLIDAEFSIAGMPDHPLVTADQFLECIGPFFLQGDVVDLLQKTGQDL